ncbi:GNAT family N-acetyltransferase [Cuniculiplasma sp. SKW3]|uniref:GNAT family N-acetyltransferase n=1 Tax=Cuniculiplasma sp. SKW3 TaxID=3400170 RepID=UPI003FD2526E
MIREIKWTDMHDIIDNYYGYYDELEDEPDLGLAFYRIKPDFRNEVEWFANLYEDVISGNAVAVVSEEDGRVVGLCDIHRIRPNSELDHVGILGIAIIRQYRNRGIGNELIRKALELSRGKFEIVELEVFAVNRRAISLYKNCGYKEFGMLPNSIKRGERYYDQILMYYRLDEQAI